MPHDHDREHSDLDLCPEPLLGGPPVHTIVWLVTDALGGHVGVGETERAAEQIAVDDFALLPRRQVRTWPELARCGLYIIDEVALVKERR